MRNGGRKMEDLILWIKRESVIGAKEYHQMKNEYGQEQVDRVLIQMILSTCDNSKSFYQNQLQIWEKYGYFLATLEKNPFEEEYCKKMQRKTENKEGQPLKLFSERKETAPMTTTEEVHYGFHLLKRDYLVILEPEKSIDINLYQVFHSVKTREMGAYLLTKFNDFYCKSTRNSIFDQKMKTCLFQFQQKYFEGIIPTPEDLNLIKDEKTPEVLSEEDLKEQIDMYISYSLARSKYEQSNIRLSYLYARKLMRHTQYNEEIFDDFVQDGIMGIKRAVDTYDIRTCLHFSGYAWQGIRNFVWRSKSELISPIHISYQVRDRINRIKKQQEEIYLEKGIRVPISELIARLNISQYGKQQLINGYNCIKMKSLNQTVVEAEGWKAGVTLEEIVPDQNSDYSESVLENYDFMRFLAYMDKTLTAREKDILLKRAGYHVDHPMTLEEIAQEYHVTREGIRQAESKAIRKLTKTSKGQSFNPYV